MKNYKLETERYKNLLARSAVALKEGPLAEADLATEIEQELISAGPVSTTWYVGVHCAIERLREALQTEKEYLAHLQNGEEVSLAEEEHAKAIIAAYGLAIAELHSYMGEA